MVQKIDEGKKRQTNDEMKANDNHILACIPYSLWPINVERESVEISAPSSDKCSLNIDFSYLNHFHIAHIKDTLCLAFRSIAQSVCTVKRLLSLRLQDLSIIYFFLFFVLVVRKLYTLSINYSSNINKYQFYIRRVSTFKDKQEPC